jgi:hypothetical protein
MKRSLSVILSLMLCLWFVVPAFANDMFSIGSSTYSVNGQQYNMDAAPYVENGRTMLPVKYVAEALGVPDNNIMYDQSSQRVTIINSNQVIQLTIGSTTMILNGTPITMDTAPEISSDRTYLPVAWLAQALGATISWNASTQQVTVVTGDSPQQATASASGSGQAATGFEQQQGTTNEVLPGTGQSSTSSGTPPTSSGTSANQPSAQTPSDGSAGGSEQETVTGTLGSISSSSAQIVTSSGQLDLPFVSNAIVILNGQPTCCTELDELLNLNNTLSVSALVNGQGQITAMNVSDSDESFDSYGNFTVTGLLVSFEGMSAQVATKSGNAEFPIITDANVGVGCALFGYDEGMGAHLESELQQGIKMSITAYVNGQGQIHAMSIAPIQPAPSTGFGAQQ